MLRGASRRVSPYRPASGASNPLHPARKKLITVPSLLLVSWPQHSVANNHDGGCGHTLVVARLPNLAPIPQLDVGIHSPTIGERGHAEKRTVGQAGAPNEPLVSEIISLSPPRYLGSPSEPIRGVRSNSFRYHPEPELSKLSGLSKLHKRAFWGDAASPSHPIPRNSRLFPL